MVDHTTLVAPTHCNATEITTFKAALQQTSQLIGNVTPRVA
jgi:hypothetical protein